MQPKVDLQLPRTAPEQQGIASAAILRFVEALDSQIREVHSFMLLRHGKVMAEGWWSPYGREYRHHVFSVSKSFTSTAVGLAVSEGYFTIDDPVLSFFPEDVPTEVNEHLAQMRVRHLLSMSTGHADDTWAHMENRADGNWIRAFFGVPVIYAPGTHFLYNTGASYMLAAIVQKTTGMKLIDYLQPRLFQPLGIDKATWQESPQGIALGGIGLSITTEGLARFGQLYLQKGMWEGKQILSEAWIAEATSVQMATDAGAESDWGQGYGYQFWRGRHNTYRADGVFGQYSIVMPDQDAVLAMTGGTDIFEAQLPLNLLWEHVLPAMQMDDHPLGEDAEAQQRLLHKLSTLTLGVVQGQAISSVAAQVSNLSYKADSNALTLETIGFQFSESGCLIRIKTARGEEMIPCGYGTWQRGQSTLFNEGGRSDPMATTASGAWTDDSTFTMVIRLYETPFYYTIVCHFMGDELLIEAQVSASLGATTPLLLTARC